MVMNTVAVIEVTVVVAQMAVQCIISFIMGDSYPIELFQYFDVF